MKIAIAADGSKVSGHFGHCQSFKMYEIQDAQVTSQNEIQNPGHKPGFLPKFLNEQNVNCIIVGGMGQKAQKIFDHYNIETFTGIQGEVPAILDQFLAGMLTSKPGGCSHDHHHGGSSHDHPDRHGNCQH